MTVIIALTLYAVAAAGIAALTLGPLPLALMLASIGASVFLVWMATSLLVHAARRVRHRRGLRIEVERHG